MLLGATPVGAANAPELEEELMGVGNTMVSGTGPVEPTELAALLKVGDRGLLGISPVGATTWVRSLLVLATEEASEKVGEASSVSGRRPVDATKVDVAGADEVMSEAIVGETSSVLGRRPVEATKVDSAGVDELALEEAKVGEGSSVSGNRPVEAMKDEAGGADDSTSEAIVGDGSSVSGRLPVDATKVELGAADELALEGAVG